MPWDEIAKTIGLGEGGLVRNGYDALLAAFGLDGAAKTPAHQRAAFTVAFVALAAKMAKADGCVSDVEAETFARLYEVSPDEAANVKQLFDLASADSAGFESYARRIARLLAEEPRLLRDVFDGLFHIAAADGILHPAEDAFLRRVAEIFAIADAEFRSIRSAFVCDTSAMDGVNVSPYGILGLSPSATNAELKARYRQLARDHHPDSLAARGVPVEFHAASGHKLAVINAAYDAILKRRGLKESLVPAGAEP